MKTFTKSMLAVTGLALSLAACGPGLKGEGQKKPNLQRQLKAEAKLLKIEAEKNPNIKSISLGEADEDDILVKIELANADDVENKSIDGLVTLDGAINSDEPTIGKVVDGKANVYKISLACLEECTMIAGILDTEFGVAQPTEEPTKEEAKEEPKEENKEAAKDDSTKESKDEELFSAQSGTTAPEAKPAAVADSVRTGVIVSATGKVLHQEQLDSAATVEQSLEVMEAMIKRMKPLGMIK